MSECMRLFGRDINRTSGELEAVLTQLQLGEIPTRGLFERVVLCCLFCLSRRSYLWRSSASSGAIAWSCSCGSCLVYERREVFVHERSRVLRCHLGCLSLFFSLLVRLFVRWHYAEHIGDWGSLACGGGLRFGILGCPLVVSDVRRLGVWMVVLSLGHQ